MTPLQLRANVELDLAARDGAAPKQPTFSALAYSGGPLRLPEWPYPVVVALAGLEIPAHVAVLLDHDQRAIVGQGKASIDGSTVRLNGVVTGDPAAPGDPAHTVVEHAKRGFRWSVSIGASAHRTITYPARDARVKVNGREFPGPLIVVHEARLGEVSFVAAGADSRATAEVIAKMEPIENDNGVTTDPALLERQRVTEIRAACCGEYGDLEAQAIEAGWSAERTRAVLLERVRGARPKAPHVRTGGGLPDDVRPRDVLAAAVLLHAGRAATAEKQIGARPAQAAADLRCRTLLDICAAGLVLAGQDVPRDKSELVRAAFSTTSMPTALGDTAYKIALDQYTAAPATWRTFAKIVPTRDFKPTRLVRAVFGGGFEPIAPGGEIKHGTLGEDAYSVQADTRGKMLTIDRRDIINDDAGLLLGTAEGLGRMSARCVGDLVYQALLANLDSAGEPFFAAENDNYLDGADTALGFASLALAITSQRDRVDSDGREIDVPPKTLLVPTVLETVARQLLSSEAIARDTDNEGDQLGTGNPFGGLLGLAVEPRLGGARFAGSSTKAWYLFGAPADGAVAVAFLDGREGPTIEQVDAGPNVLGLVWRGYVDVGVSLADGRACTKVKGEA